MNYLILAFDTIIVLATSLVALRCTKVWWSYVMAGELLFSYGSYFLFDYLYRHNLVTDNWWYFLIAAIQSLTVIALIQVATPIWIRILYLFTATSAFSMGILVTGGNYDHRFAYIVFFVLADVAKLGIVTYGWRVSLCNRSDTRYNRLHVWES